MVRDEDALAQVLADTEATLVRTREEVQAHERLPRERVEALERELASLTARQQEASLQKQRLEQSAAGLEGQLESLGYATQPRLAQLKGRERFAAASWSLALLLGWGLLVVTVAFYWQGRFRLPALAAVGCGLAVGFGLSRLRKGERR